MPVAGLHLPVCVWRQFVPGKPARRANTDSLRRSSVILLPHPSPETCRITYWDHSHIILFFRSCRACIDPPSQEDKFRPESQMPRRQAPSETARPRIRSAGHVAGPSPGTESGSTGPKFCKGGRHSRVFLSVLRDHLHSPQTMHPVVCITLAGNTEARGGMRRTMERNHVRPR